MKLSHSFYDLHKKIEQFWKVIAINLFLVETKKNILNGIAKVNNSRRLSGHFETIPIRIRISKAMELTVYGITISPYARCFVWRCCLGFLLVGCQCFSV